MNDGIILTGNNNLYGRTIKVKKENMSRGVKGEMKVCGEKRKGKKQKEMK